MIEIECAIEKVSSRLAEMSTDGVLFVIDHKNTIEKSFGWVFFYNSQEYLETKNPIHQLAGNGPIFFNKKNGEIVFGVSFKRLEQQIKEYESRINAD